MDLKVSKNFRIYSDEKYRKMKKKKLEDRIKISDKVGKTYLHMIREIGK